jgi:hypothetical protein
MEALEDHPDALPPEAIALGRRHLPEGSTRHHHLAPAREQKTGHDVQEGALAAPRGSVDQPALAARDPPLRHREHQGLVVAVLEVEELDHRRHCPVLLGRARRKDATQSPLRHQPLRSGQAPAGPREDLAESLALPHPARVSSYRPLADPVEWGRLPALRAGRKPGAPKGDDGDE